jgi:hypothetical protein
MEAVVEEAVLLLLQLQKGALIKRRPLIRPLIQPTRVIVPIIRPHSFQRYKS